MTAAARALFLVLTCCTASAGVVINEILYNAPDDLEDLEYIELHNASDAPADLGGWRFSKGIKFEFKAGTVLPPRGFLVLCRNSRRFAQFYDAPIAGNFSQKLSNDGETLELADASGSIVDSLGYQDGAPWPLGADGESGSLERISPNAPGSLPENWAASPLSENRALPGGSPGRPNAAYSAELPPIILSVTTDPEQPRPGQAIAVKAILRDTNSPVRMTLLWQAIQNGDLGRAETAVPMRAEAPGQFSASIMAPPGSHLLRFRVGARSLSGATRYFPAATEPRPTLSLYAAEPISAGKIPAAIILAPASVELASRQRPRRWRGPREDFGQGPPAPHTSAFVYHDPETQKTELFDHVQIASRKAGWKVRLGKGQLLRGMSTLNLTFENDRGMLAEALAYEVYRRAGIAAPLSWHVRLTFNGQAIGHHLLFEQPNRAFLRRNKMPDDGNMYKILWYENGIEGQHEKKTNTQEGHEDIVALIAELESAKGEAQWAVIQKHFDVPQVAGYFALNTVLSHWDGFFNNYFTYHDLSGSEKWTMHPWDQDQTWGIINGGWNQDVFFDMPLTFGMAGDVPPGESRPNPRGDRFRFGRGGPGWWRPGGWFSAPLLANPHFRKVFLARTREILETVYTPEKMAPLFEAMRENLREEVTLRAEITGGDARHDLDYFELCMRGFEQHVRLRRQFLLSQPELKGSAE